MPNTGNRDEVIARLCMICAEIQHYKYKYDVPADCFCHKSEVDKEHYQFELDVVDYIEEAVRAKLVTDKLVTK